MTPIFTQEDVAMLRAHADERAAISPWLAEVIEFRDLADRIEQSLARRGE